MNIRIGASLSCANNLALAKDIEDLIKNKVDFLHIDIMDGIFVKNYCFGTNILDYLTVYKNIEIDAHLMVCDPFEKIDFFRGKSLTRMSFHMEACDNPIQTLKKIRSFGFKAGIAINAGTHESSLKYLYEFADYILVMAVEAGFTGQEFIESAVEKVSNIRVELEKKKCSIDIYVDGHITPFTVNKLFKAGANAFIGGSAGLFRKDKTIKKSIEDLKNSIYE